MDELRGRKAKPHERGESYLEMINHSMSIDTPKMKHLAYSAQRELYQVYNLMLDNRKILLNSKIDRGKGKIPFVPRLNTLILGIPRAMQSPILSTAKREECQFLVKPTDNRWVPPLDLLRRSPSNQKDSLSENFSSLTIQRIFEFELSCRASDHIVESAAFESSSSGRVPNITLEVSDPHCGFLHFSF